MSEESRFSKEKSSNLYAADDEDDNFPIGMQVLAIDSNVVCLKILVTLLQKCQYQVTATTKADEALAILKENKKIDLVITDVKRPDIDGFKLLEIIGLQMGLPVVMVSADGDRENILLGARHGAKDYLLKPIRLLEIKNIWQHVFRNRMMNPKKTITEREIQCGQDDPSKEHKSKSKRSDTTTSDESSSTKKPRLKWTKELHQKFVEVVELLGVTSAVPREIYQIMGVKELTRDQIASHLQKYRSMVKRKKKETLKHQGLSSNLYDSGSSNGAIFPGTLKDYILNGPMSDFRPLGSSLMNFGSTRPETCNTSSFTNVHNQDQNSYGFGGLRNWSASLQIQNQNGFTGYQGPGISSINSNKQWLQHYTHNTVHPQGHSTLHLRPHQASSSNSSLPQYNLNNLSKHSSSDHMLNSLQAQNGGQRTHDPLGTLNHHNIDQVPMLPDIKGKSILPDASRTTSTTMLHHTSGNLDMEIGGDQSCPFTEEEIMELLIMFGDDAVPRLP